MRMTKEQLIKKFPWVNTSIPAFKEDDPNSWAALVNTNTIADYFYEAFTDEMWQAMDEFGMAKKLKSNILPPLYIYVFFETIAAMLKEPKIIRLLQSGLTSLQKIIKTTLEQTLAQLPAGNRQELISLHQIIKLPLEQTKPQLPADNRQLPIDPIELMELYPWTNRMSIPAFVGKFTRSEWHDMHESGLPEFLEKETLDPALITSLFNSILIISKNKDIAQSIAKGEFTFKAIVAQQIDLLNKMDKQHKLVRPQEVVDWLGATLILQMEQQLKTYEQMDNLVQLLSRAEIRQELDAMGARQALSEQRMNFIKLLDIAIQIHNTNERSTPFVGNNFIFDTIEFHSLARHFTDRQVGLLMELLAPSIKQNTNLRCSFMRTLLLATTVNGEQLIMRCPLEYFSQLVLNQQEKFLKTAQKDIAKMVVPEASLVTDRLIRKYVKEYQSPHVPLPSNPHWRQEAIDSAFREAAAAGTFWDLVVLVSQVSNINAQSLASGRTALHGAAEYAHAKSDSLCYDFLMAQPGIDPSLKNKQGQTASDLKAPRPVVTEERLCYVM